MNNEEIRYVNYESGKGAVACLKFFAWVNLIGSIIAAIAVWANYGSKEKFPGEHLSSITDANPLGIGIGIAILVQGIIFFSVCSVLWSIAQNVIVIRELIEVEERKGEKTHEA